MNVAPNAAAASAYSTVATAPSTARVAVAPLSTTATATAPSVNANETVPLGADARSELRASVRPYGPHHTSTTRGRSSTTRRGGRAGITALSSTRAVPVTTPTSGSRSRTVWPSAYPRSGPTTSIPRTA